MAIASFREEELFRRIKWFIKLRWMFLGGLIVTIIVGTQILKIELPLVKILTVGLVIFLYNSILFLYHRHLNRWWPENLKSIRIEANLQVYLDLLSLTILIHFSGGVENPFISFYLFHAIIGSILLSKVEVWVAGLASVLLFMTTVLLEFFEVIPHYHFSNFFNPDDYQNILFVSVVCLSLIGAIFITIYISSSIVHGIWMREKALFLTRDMLQKKTEDLKRANREKQKQLVQSEKLSSLGQLVSGSAHEINNPVQFILGNMRIFNEAFEDILPILDAHAEKHPDLSIARLNYPFFRDQIQVMLQDMITGAMRIRDIVADLKTFARRDEGRLDEEVNLNEVVKVCLRLVHNRVKRYRVEEDLEQYLPKVLGSENKLAQVIIVCLINAAEALGDRKDGTIRISTRTEDGGRGICLSIADNGPGMSDEVKQNIFNPFYTTKQDSGGTGLGLSIGHGIIEEHGGTIEVESNPGQGAVFKFHLPVKRQK